MADIRIKDLTTTASSSASDDFIAVDGTTNGTRKLNAFSPTFGGNATVTGTLTVNGASTLTGATTIGGILRIGDASTGLYFSENTGNVAYVTTGLGTAATGFYIGTATNIPIRFLINSTVVGRFAPTTGNLLIGTEADIAGSGGLRVAGTTASTSTSSGALVVSGGVGVAGAIYAGDNIRVTNSFAGLNGFSIFNTNTGGLPGLYIEGDGGEYALIRRHNSTAANPRRLEYIATGSGANHYFNTNTTIAGTITTAAPSGGTAAAWKLGTVASVSPTSPNRTIEVDIGGTIYYIHAKTTNN